MDAHGLDVQIEMPITGITLSALLLELLLGQVNAL
jgi:hypothetical protein